MIALIPVGLLFAGVAGAEVTDRALKPVAQIARNADRIDAQDLTQRLEVAGSDEYSHLAGTFNRMLGRLEGAFARQQALVAQLEKLLDEQKRFTADASHELKTPLSVIKIHSGLLLRSQPTQADYLESVESSEREPPLASPSLRRPPDHSRFFRSAVGEENAEVGWYDACRAVESPAAPSRTRAADRYSGQPRGPPALLAHNLPRNFTRE